MNLYFISTYHDDDGDGDQDLHVMASTRAEAVAYWLGYYELEPEDVDCIQRIFVVNPRAPAGPIRWHGPDCKEVA